LTPYNLRTLVEARADGRCEYCRRYQELIGGSFFEVEHIVPRSRGGLTVPGNLAFACRRCNLLKGPAIEALDPETSQLAHLFHPRLDDWYAHFERSHDRLQIIGLTPIGRVTVLRLRLNNSSEQRAREIQRDHLAMLFPLD
jgi:HNH endonuclease